MIFDKEGAIDKVKSQLSQTDRAKIGQIEQALSLTIDEMSLRLRSVMFIRSYSQTLAVSAREVTLTGEHQDLRSIYALKIGSGATERILEYRRPDIFLRDHDVGTVSSGSPKYYTVLESSSTYPVVRFDVPLMAAETLLTYYYYEMTPDNMTAINSVAPIVEGTLARFYGVDDIKGVNHYQNFTDLVALLRANDSPVPAVSSEIRRTKEDRNIAAVVNAVRNRRL